MRWIAVKRLRLSRISANTAFPALIAPDIVFKNTDCCIGCSFPLPETRMKMPKYEKIRNKRMGLFRRRDPEKPSEPPSRLWTFLNSSFGLWVLTATFGSLVAATYSSLQVCIKDADDRVAKYSRLQSEIQSRQSEILEAINRAESIDDLRSRLKNIAANRHEFKDTPLRSLNLDYRDIQNLIRPHEIVAATVRQVSDAYGFTYEDRKYLSVVDGTLPDDISETELPKITAGNKLSIEHLLPLLHLSRRASRLAADVPAASPRSVPGSASRPGSTTMGAERPTYRAEGVASASPQLADVRRWLVGLGFSAASALARREYLSHSGKMS
jgi:hypothetical protein